MKRVDDHRRPAIPGGEPTQEPSLRIVGVDHAEPLPADDPDDLAALDAAWEEEQIRFDAPLAPGTADCPQVAGMVDRMLAQEPVRSHAHG